MRTCTHVHMQVSCVRCKVVIEILPCAHVHTCARAGVMCKVQGGGRDFTMCASAHVQV